MAADMLERDFIEASMYKNRWCLFDAIRDEKPDRLILIGQARNGHLTLYAKCLKPWMLPWEKAKTNRYTLMKYKI